MSARQRFSLRTVLGLIISLMGALGLLLALVSGEVHRSHAFDNHRQSMEKFLQLKSADLIEDLAGKAAELGMSLQSEQGFRDAFFDRKLSDLEWQLANQFKRYFVTAELIRLEKLIVLDPELLPVAAKAAEFHRLPKNDTVCPDLLQSAMQRSGPERLKIMSDLCFAGGRPYHAVLMPIGGILRKGYLLVVTDPSHSLTRLESALETPLILLSSDGEEIYRSDRWPAPEAMEQSFVTEYVVRAADGSAALKLRIAEDIQPLFGHLPQTRVVVMAAASFVTVLALLLATWVLRRTTLRPLQTLTRQLRLVRGDRAYIGQRVEAGGIKEIYELSEDFNAMSLELGKLYQSLQTMAYTDPLTELPNRAQFHLHLQDVMQAHQYRHMPFAVCLMDVDRFKEVNDTLGHHVGDRLLCAISERLQKALRRTDVVTRLGSDDLTDLGQGLVARLGGDEFAAILPNIETAEQAAVAVEKMLKGLEEPFLIDGQRLQSAASIGVALCPEHSSNHHDLMRMADIAMYQAKRNGLGYCLYETKFERERTGPRVLN